MDRTYRRSPETRAKISAALKGRTISDEHRRKLSDANKGRTSRPVSDETKALMSAAKTGKKQSPEHIAKRIAAISATKRAKAQLGE